MENPESIILNGIKYTRESKPSKGLVWDDVEDEDQAVLFLKQLTCDSENIERIISRLKKYRFIHRLVLDDKGDVWIKLNMDLTFDCLSEETLLEDLDHE